MSMIHVDVLEGLLAETAESFDVPPRGAVEALARARRVANGREKPWRSPAVSRRRFAGVVAAAAVVVVGAVVIHHGSSPRMTTSAGVATVAAKPAAPAPAAGASAGGSGAGTQRFGPQSANRPNDTLTPLAGALDSGKATTATTATGSAAAPAQAGFEALSQGLSSGAATGGSLPTVDGAVVVRTGSATLVVPKGDVASSVTALQKSASGLGGYLQSSNTSGSSATATVRVPVDRFETLLAALPPIGDVTDSQTSSSDVTGQSVDLAARLKAAEASRSTYLTILSKATTIGDTLSVQQRLDDLQTQIEQLQAQQKTLADQASLATLSVTIDEQQPTPAPAPKPAGPRTGFDLAVHQAWDHFRDGLQDVVAATGGIALAVIALLVLIPLGRIALVRYRRAIL